MIIELIVAWNIQFSFFVGKRISFLNNLWIWHEKWFRSKYIKLLRWKMQKLSFVRVMSDRELQVKQS